MSHEGADIFFFPYKVFLLHAFAVMIRDPFDPMRPALHPTQPIPRATLRPGKVTAPIHSPPTHLHENQAYIHPCSKWSTNSISRQGTGTCTKRMAPPSTLLSPSHSKTRPPRHQDPRKLISSSLASCAAVLMPLKHQTRGRALFSVEKNPKI